MTTAAGRKRSLPRRRGPWPAAAILLAGAVCCWTGLVQVDRQIRSVTIQQSPPLWETRLEGDVRSFTLLGRTARVDAGPLRRAGEELRLILETPPPAVRVAQVLLYQGKNRQKDAAGDFFEDSEKNTCNHRGEMVLY